MKVIDASGIKYKELNEIVDETIILENNIELQNIFGQRYIGRVLPKGKKLTIKGTPGNDMAAYMDGGDIEVFGNAQDAAGNTMNDGKIIVHGNCGDTAGYAMRGGQIYIENNAGYRVGIHMKEYKDMKPLIVIGKKAGDFLGEYMAGGTIIVLGLDLDGQDLTGKFCGTGMHGGKIYLAKKAQDYKLGKEAVKVKLDEQDKTFIKEHLDNYSKYFKKDLSSLKIDSFVKYAAVNKNPYKNIYCKL
jgi:glutamate synthase domain-containing protein 3